MAKGTDWPRYGTPEYVRRFREEVARVAALHRQVEANPGYCPPTLADAAIESAPAGNSRTAWAQAESSEAES